LVVLSVKHRFLVVDIWKASMLRDTARKLLLFYLVVGVIINPVELASGKSSRFSEILVLVTVFSLLQQMIALQHNNSRDIR
jgi:hypothetical protein